MSLDIRNLRPEDDLGRAAEILFQSDPYIMPDLFGDQRTARLIGGCLFSEDPEQLFCFDRTLVAVQDGVIQGILCYRTGVCQWDEQILRDAYARKGCTLPAQFERVNREYFDKVTYAELPQDGAECMFLAVDQVVRGQKIGSQLLQFWLKLEFAVYTLDVLSENKNAIALYSQHAFTVVYTHMAYPKQCSRQCLCMQRRVQEHME